MTAEQWELLCDGCGRCCLHKVQDEDSDELFYTNVSCRLLDEQDCQCRHYDQRMERVSTCFLITPDNVDALDWLPNTCAYRILAQGRQLAWWHPLLSGDPKTVIEAGISVKGKFVNEENVHPDSLPEFVISWLDEDVDRADD